jgi:hypothetical protein
MSVFRPFFLVVILFALVPGLACGTDDDVDVPNPDVGSVDDTANLDDVASLDAPEDDANGDTAEVEDIAPDVPTFRRDPAERYALANRCAFITASMAEDSRSLSRVDGAFAFVEGVASARFDLRASDLGTYLLRDEQQGFVVATVDGLGRSEQLESDITRVEDGFVSPAEWLIEEDVRTVDRFVLRNRATGEWLSLDGLASDAREAASVVFEDATDCAGFPELSLDASGTPTRTTWPDGDVYGFVDAHSHILSNFGFGGGGIFHGSPFHRLGVEHAMGDCTQFHAEGGRADLLGFGFSGPGALDETQLISLLATGRLTVDSHSTDGWPTFSGWPSRDSATHQTQYYRWLERAWLSGLRLVVQHAVSNEAFCDMTADPGHQPVRWGCEDMVNIDRQLIEIRNMERYIDAQAGGPGEGFFRVVESPAEAREVIEDGKLAVVLGIEVSNLFDCYLTPRPGSADCTSEHIQRELDTYYERGVRVLFPNHKFDNAFTAGDGHRGIVELGNFYTTGHWNNFVPDCPDVPSTFDRGGVQFAGFNEPREEYHAEPPNPLIDLTLPTLVALGPYLDRVREAPLDGEYCQKTGLTDAGRELLDGMMDRGMIVEIDHLPRRAYAEAFSILEAAGYPAAGTHGNTNRGDLYSIGGRSKTGFGRCAAPDAEAPLWGGFRDRRAQIEAVRGYPSEGFGFDLNGLAGVPGPRFGERANCGHPQENPVTYPFTSVDGGVTFTQPSIGEREIDFNTEGMIHIGLVAEYVQDALATGATDEDVEFLFRSAEGYLRMWELAEARARARDDNASLD